MKIYITKPKHTKYGSIPIENSFTTVEDLIEHSMVWLIKPYLEKPFMDIFGGGFCLRPWGSRYRCSILFKYFPEGQVKEEIRKIIRQSINDDFSETLHNRHHKWIGELEVDLTRRDTPGNFDLYLTKPPSAWDVNFAGVDRAKIFFNKPCKKTLRSWMDGEDHEMEYYIVGEFFRRNPDFESLTLEMWEDIKNTFTIPQEDYLYLMDETRHKENQGPADFIKPFFFDLKIKKNH